MADRLEYPRAMVALVEMLRRLPGVGPRSAERMALWLLGGDASLVGQLIERLEVARASVRACSACGFFTTDPLCPVCASPQRQGARMICVVEQPSEILPLERAGVFQGVYHSLGGRLSPLSGVGPEQLRLEALLQRVGEIGAREVILALSGEVEGEATASYIARLLEPTGVVVSRLAQGLPAGSSLEVTDPATLAKALEFRTSR